MDKGNEIKLELLKCSYWEHFKFAKDIALILPVDHPKRRQLEKEINSISAEIKIIEDKKNNLKNIQNGKFYKM